MMFETTKEFWLKWRLRVAEQRILDNTSKRKKQISKDELQVKKYEKIKEKLEAYNVS